MRDSLLILMIQAKELPMYRHIRLIFGWWLEFGKHGLGRSIFKVTSYWGEGLLIGIGKYMIILSSMKIKEV